MRHSFVLSFLLLASCAEEAPDARTIRLAAKLVRVDMSARQIDLDFAPGRIALAPDQIARLDAFLADADEADRVSLAARPDDPLAAQRLAQTMLVLRHDGIVARAAPPLPGAAGYLTVAIERATAAAPACPLWTAQDSGDFANLPGTNFGCATATNLAAMVADPADLLAGRAHGAFDAEPATLAVRRYQTDKITPLNANTGLPVAAPAASAPPAPAAQGSTAGTGAQ